MGSYDVQAIREALPLVREYAYLNTGTEGILAEPVLAAYQAAVARQEREGHVALAWLHEEAQAARAAVARLLHSSPEAIAFTRNASDGHNLVLHGLPWRPGDELLLSAEEHPALTHPVAFLRAQRGVVAKTFRVEADPAATLAGIRRLLTPHTRVIAFSHVSCESGIQLPAREICALAREHGCLSLVDGAQSLGAVAVDVTSLGCDFFVSNGHKWLCGPKGTGILYVAPARLNELAVVMQGAGTYQQFRWEGDRFSFALQPTASRFEFGTRNLAAVVGLGAALDWLAQLGEEEVCTHITATAQQCGALLAELPRVNVITPLDPSRLAGIVTFSMNGQEPSALARTLWEQRIITRPTSHPPGVRVSTAYFTSPEDCARLIAALHALG